MPLSFFLLAVAAVIYQGPQPLVDELQSFWLAIHVGVSLLGYAAFALAFATGFFYVIQEDLIKKRYAQVRRLILGLVVALGTGLGAYVGYLIARSRCSSRTRPGTASTPTHAPTGPHHASVPSSGLAASLHAWGGSRPAGPPAPASPTGCRRSACSTV